MALPKVLFVVCICWLWSLGCATVAWGAPRAVATVLAASGTLNVQRAGQPAGQMTPLRVRAALLPGDVVVTGANGRAFLLFDDGSHVKMRENSRLEIFARQGASSGGSLFRALLGRIWARLRPGRSAKTVYTNLVVRGTEFQVDVEEDGTTTLTVIEGTVDFSNQFGAVAVNASQQSVAEPGKAPTIPVTIANPGLIIEWTQQIDFAAVPREKFWTTRDKRLAAQDANRLRAANAAPLQIGEALFDAGEPEAALAQFELAGANAQVHRGHALLELGRLDEAELAFRAALDDANLGSAARLGLAWTMLERNLPAQARDAVAPLVAANAGNGEARLALAIALMRAGQTSSENNAAAIEHLKAALDGPESIRYQARAWLAGAYLSQGKNEEAQREAEAAAQIAPDSALAQGQLATVSFFNNRPAHALRAARRAALLDSESVGGQMALAQAALAAGQTDEGAVAAARAVALDSKSPQAHFLLGIADAGRRDYRHAISALQESLQLAPEFYPALNALARVYVRAGREKDAELLLAAYAKRPENDQILSARGEFYYNTGQYRNALADYRRALYLRPNSALTWANFARTAIDANYLAEAINAGQQAVKLAPDIGAYHSILGLAYDFSRMQAQAERSYRTALVLDPADALALVKLGRLQREGDARLTERTGALTFAQGFLFDPAVSGRLQRGGMKSELGGRAGNKTRVGGFEHRIVADDGNLQVFNNFFQGKDDGDRANTQSSLTTLSQDTTLQQGRTTLYSHLLHARQDGGLPGPLSTPALDDRQSLSINEGILAVRHRLNGRAHLWAGVLGLSDRNERLDPNQDYSFSMILPAGFIQSVGVAQQIAKTNTLATEVRMDWRLRDDPMRPATLTLGVARPRSETFVASQIFSPSVDPSNPDLFPPVVGNYTLRQKAPLTRLYAQWDERFNSRFSLTAQVRHEKDQRTLSAKGIQDSGPIIGTLPLDAPPVTMRYRRTLPSLVANYRSGARTNFRVMASRRATDITSSLFAPVGTLLNTEDQVLFAGLPDPSRNGDSNVLQVDMERYLKSGGLLKLFAFHTQGRNITYDFSQFTNPSDPELDIVFTASSFQFERLRRQGAGVRFEQPLGKGFFARGLFSFNRTTATAMLTDPLSTPNTMPAPFNGGTAPYSPKRVASLGLNYVHQSGAKAGIALNYNGPIFADTIDLNAPTRPRLGATTTVDFNLAYEPTVRAELFLTVRNLFDKQQFIYNDIPLHNRRVSFGVRRRF